MQNSNYYSSEVKMPSFDELGIDKAKILRVIEKLKVNGNEVHPGSIALELGIPRTYIYENLELLEIVYASMERPFGHDKLILDLINTKNKLERKVKKLEKYVSEKEREAKSSFNDGFSQGASMNFEKAPSQVRVQEVDNLSAEKEIWARSLLYIPFDQELDLVTIKRSYRKLVGLIHPDITQEDTNEMFAMVKEAYNYLLSKYN
jgi:hypothetical protein